jgi:hypothetical protein
MVSFAHVPPRPHLIASLACSETDAVAPGDDLEMPPGAPVTAAAPFYRSQPGPLQGKCAYVTVHVHALCLPCYVFQVVLLVAENGVHPRMLLCVHVFSLCV